MKAHMLANFEGPSIKRAASLSIDWSLEGFSEERPAYMHGVVGACTWEEG